MDKIEFTPSEERVLMRSGDFSVVKRFQASSILISAVFIGLVTSCAILTKSWVLMLVISIAYIIITLTEKLFYARALIAYKSVIVKLGKRINELSPKK